MITTDIIYTSASPDDPAVAPGGMTWAEEALMRFSDAMTRHLGAPDSVRVRVLWASQSQYMPGVCAGTLAVSSTGQPGDDAIINIAVYGQATTGRVIRMLTPVIF